MALQENGISRPTSLYRKTWYGLSGRIAKANWHVLKARRTFYCFASVRLD